MSSNKTVIYKCPRFEEKKRAQERLDELAIYYDGQPELILPPDYSCPECWGGLNCKGITTGKACVVVIDYEQTNWKKHRRFFRKLITAIRKQKERDKRKQAAEEARKDREERILCGWNNFGGFCMDLLAEEGGNNEP